MFKSDSPLFVKKKKGCLLPGLAEIVSVVLENNRKNKVYSNQPIDSIKLDAFR